MTEPEHVVDMAEIAKLVYEIFDEYSVRENLFNSTTALSQAVAWHHSLETKSHGQEAAARVMNAFCDAVLAPDKIADVPYDPFGPGAPPAAPHSADRRIIKATGPRSTYQSPRVSQTMGSAKKTSESKAQQQGKADKTEEKPAK